MVESIMLTIKSVVFLAMELYVFGVMVAALIARLYRIVRDSIQSGRVVPAGRSYLPTRAS